jgi:PAS domain S-box-containing protein
MMYWLGIVYPKVALVFIPANWDSNPAMRPSLGSGKESSVSRFSFASLRVRLILLVLLAVIPAFGLTLYTAREDRRHETSGVQENALRLARLTAADHERLIAGTRQLLVALAQLPAVRDGDPAACSALFADLLKRYRGYTGFAVSKPDGDVFCSATPLTQPINFADRAWFQRVVQTRDFVAGEYQIGRISGKATLILAYPVLDAASQVQAVVSAGLDLAWLSQLAAEAQLPPGATLTAMDHNATILARYPDPEKWVGQSLPEAPIVETILTQQGEGTVETAGVDGVQRLYAFVSLRGAPGDNVYLSVGIPTAIAYAEADRALARNLAGLGLAAMLVLAAAWGFGDVFIMRRVNDLVSATQRLAASDLSARTGLPYGVGELSQLAQTFDEMAEALEQREAERQRAEEALQESEARYRAVVESQTELIDRWRPDGTLTFVNEAYCRYYGKPREELIGHKWMMQVAEEDQERVKAYVEHLMTSLSPANPTATDEHREVMADGRIRWQQWSDQALFDEQGHLVEFQCVGRDITKRKRAEEALRESEEKYRNLVERASDGIAIVQDAIVKYVNPSLAEVVGCTIEELIGTSFADYVHPDDRREVTDRYRRRMAGRQVTPVYEIAVRRKDGSKVYVGVNAGVITYQGKPAELVIIRDITKRKEAEEEIKRLYQQTLTRAAELAALNHASQSITSSLDIREVLSQIVNLAGSVVNAAHTSVVLVEEDGSLGLSAENFREGPSIEIRARPQGITRQIIASRQPLVFDAVADDGTHNPALLAAGVRSYAGLPLIVKEAVLGVLFVHSRAPGAFRDRLPVLTTFANQAAIAIENARLYQAAKRELAERMRAEEALRESKRQLNVLFEQLPIGVSLLDQNREMILANPALEKILDISRDDLLQGKYRNRRYIRPDGTPMPLEEFASVRAFKEQQVVRNVETGVITESGKTIWTSVSAVPFPEADKGVVITTVDITGRKRADEQIQRQLQRLAALRQIDMTITASLDLRVTLTVFLDQVTSQLQVDAATVLLLNPHTQTLEYAAGRGFRSQVLQHTHLRLGEGHAGRAALERRIVSIPDLTKAENGLRRSPLLPHEEFVAYYAVPLIAKGQIKGVLELFHRSPFDPDQEWLEFLEALASQAAIATDNATLFENLERSNVELTLAYDTTLEGWARALELRDHDTEGHSRRIADMTLRLARAMGVSEAELVHVRRGALLHDIGKMGIPDSILHKPGPLTGEEWEVMHQHPVYAYQMLSSITFLRPALDIPYCHHEKWDGTGYPRGLKGEQIPLAARIFAVVDVWDALRSERPYRPRWPDEKVLQYIQEQAGKHFDPQVVEVFLRESARPAN